MHIIVFMNALRLHLAAALEHSGVANWQMSALVTTRGDVLMLHIDYALLLQFFKVALNHVVLSVCLQKL